MNYDKPEVSGAIFGVDIERRGSYVGHNGVEYKMAPLLTVSNHLALLPLGIVVRHLHLSMI